MNRPDHNHHNKIEQLREQLDFAVRDRSAYLERVVTWLLTATPAYGAAVAVITGFLPHHTQHAAAPLLAIGAAASIAAGVDIFHYARAHITFTLTSITLENLLFNTQSGSTDPHEAAPDPGQLRYEQGIAVSAAALAAIFYLLAITAAIKLACHIETTAWLILPAITWAAGARSAWTLTHRTAEYLHIRTLLRPQTTHTPSSSGPATTN